MAYKIRWRVREVPFQDSALRVWQKDRVKAEAEKIVTQALGQDPGPITHEIGSLLGQELRDWVLRGGERFMPLPDHVLDAYWRATRGLSGFYDPLMIGLAAKAYLGLGGAGEIGEGVALAVLETPPPDGLGYVPICRPLGTAPDFICQDAIDPTIRPLVEVKATEKQNDLRKGLVEGVQTLLDIYRAWQRHRPLAKTPGLAVAVFLGQDRFEVEIVRLRFTGSDLVALRPREFVNADLLAGAKKAIWASMYVEAAIALSGLLREQSPQMVASELNSLVKLRSSVVGALSVRDRNRPSLPSGKGKKGVQKARETVMAEYMRGLEIDFSVEDLKTATAAALETEQQREDGHQWPQNDWSQVQSILGWAVSAQPRADGVELRGYRSGRRTTSRSIVARALAALERKDHGKRYRWGHSAVAAWIRGVEWTGFCDGRLQGWIPEVENGQIEGEQLLADAEIVIRKWEELKEAEDRQ